MVAHMAPGDHFKPRKVIMVKYFIIVFLVIVNCIGCANFKKWERKDQVLFGSFMVLHSVDILQTRKIMEDNNEFSEENPCLDSFGRDGATAAMILGYGVVYLAAEYIPKWRTEILTGANIVSGICVIRNESIGVGVLF